MQTWQRRLKPNGVFIPLEDLDLPEGQNVSIAITPVENSTDDVEKRLFETTRELMQVHHRNRKLTEALRQAKVKLQAQPA